jgi:hypothetical protein
MALTRKELKEVLDTLVRASQGNSDHLMGEVQKVARYFNELSGDVGTLYDILGITKEVQEDGDNEPQNAAANLVNTHADLDDVTADQHHNQVHLLWGTDHSDVDTTDTPADGEVITWDATAGKWVSSDSAGEPTSKSPRRGWRPWVLPSRRDGYRRERRRARRTGRPGHPRHRVRRGGLGVRHVDSGRRHLNGISRSCCRSR